MFLQKKLAVRPAKSFFTYLICNRLQPDFLSTYIIDYIPFIDLFITQRKAEKALPYQILRADNLPLSDWWVLWHLIYDITKL